jgi:ribonuclease BN (tRNA processing enzyme)
MQLAGVPFGQLRGVFLSHLHFDHVGGLSAVLGRRHQIRVTAPLRIYGPPGTKELVAGLLDAMRPGAEAGFGVPGEVAIPPETNIEVTEMRDGDDLTIGDFAVSVVNNTHYSFTPDDPKAKRFESLSFRFDLPDRVIVYTGDTGPSDAVETLCRDADLLVTEMIDVDAALENLRRQRQRQTGGGPAPEQGDRIARHLSTHHLTTTQIGEMAGRAGIGKVVVTHIVAGSGNIDDETKQRWLREIGESCDGPAVIAADGERF